MSKLVVPKRGAILILNNLELALIRGGLFILKTFDGGNTRGPIGWDI